MRAVSGSVPSLCVVLALGQAACGSEVVEPAAPGGGGSGGNTSSTAGMVGANAAGGVGGSRTPATDDWPAECFPPMFQAAAEGAFVGPAGVSGFGEPALSGEAMNVSLNGFERLFNRFAVARHTVNGYGFDGGITLTLPRSEPGLYSCPEAAISYSNQTAGREGNFMKTEQCCSIEIKRVGALGEPIEGTFSGVLVGRGLFSFAIAAEGELSVMNRGGPVGGSGGTGSGF